MSEKRPRFASAQDLQAAAQARRRIPPGAQRRFLREQAGVSLSELAAVVGVSAQTVLRWERGESVPAGHAAAYADALDAIAAPPPTEMTAEDRADMRARFKRGEGCSHCGGYHLHACPRVRRFSFHTNGEIAQVEFWPDGRWPTDHVIFPEQAVDPESEA